MLQSLFIRFNGKYRRIGFDEILYIEACKNYISIYTESHQYFVHTTMKHVEETLPHNLFCRIHRSSIVSLNKIKAFDHGYVYLEKKRLELGSQYADLLKSKLIILCNELKEKNGIRFHGIANSEK